MMQIYGSYDAESGTWRGAYDPSHGGFVIFEIVLLEGDALHLNFSEETEFAIVPLSAPENAFTQHGTGAGMFPDAEDTYLVVVMTDVAVTASLDRYYGSGK